MSGNANKSASSQPAPPPVPEPKVDVAATAAERALAGASKDSYASSVEDTAAPKKKAAGLGDAGDQDAGKPKRRDKAPATTMSTAASMGQSAVITG